MKVLLIAPAPPPAGGIETVTESLIGYIKSNPDVCDLVHYNTTHRFRRPTNESLPVRLYSGITNAVETLVKVKRLLNQHKPDLIHLATSASLALIKDILIIRMATRKGVPVVIHWHFGRIPALREKQNWEWQLLKKAVKKSAFSIVLDQASLHALSDEGFIQLASIPNPLSPLVIQKSRGPKSVNLKGHIGRVLFVGHIIPAKGVFELVEACTSLEQISELMLVGPCEASIKEELMNVASARDEGRWLVFTGELPMEGVLDRMAESPVLVLPSHTEGFPMVVLEAMAMGCTVVATRVGAIPQMLDADKDTPCGICIPVKSAENLKQSLQCVLNDTQYRQELGNRGQWKVLENYVIDKVIQQYHTVWKKVTTHQIHKRPLSP